MNERLAEIQKVYDETVALMVEIRQKAVGAPVSGLTYTLRSYLERYEKLIAQAYLISSGWEHVIYVGVISMGDNEVFLDFQALPTNQVQQIKHDSEVDEVLVKFTKPPVTAIISLKEIK